MKILYHATSMENLGSILENGIEARNIEKLVYLAETPQDALKFIALRFYPEMLVIKVKIPKKYEHKIIETFDHSYNFFKCRAFGYQGNIPCYMLDSYEVYTRN